MRRAIVGFLLLVLAGVAPGEASDVGRHGNVDCATSATEIVPARPRRGLLIYNNGSATVFHGQHSASDSRTLTTGNGTPLAPGQGFTFQGGEFVGAYHCIVSAGTVDVRWIETYP